MLQIESMRCMWSERNPWHRSDSTRSNLSPTAVALSAIIRSEFEAYHLHGGLRSDPGGTSTGDLAASQLHSCFCCPKQRIESQAAAATFIYPKVRAFWPRKIPLQSLGKQPFAFQEARHLWRLLKTRLTQFPR
jgi:hypothetical protein